MYVITNMTHERIELADGVFIEPKEQLTFLSVSDALWLLRDEGKLRILDATETFEERKADARAFDQKA